MLLPPWRALDSVDTQCRSRRARSDQLWILVIWICNLSGATSWSHDLISSGYGELEPQAAIHARQRGCKMATTLRGREVERECETSVCSEVGALSWHTVAALPATILGYEIDCATSAQHRYRCNLAETRPVESR